MSALLTFANSKTDEISHLKEELTLANRKNSETTLLKEQLRLVNRKTSEAATHLKEELRLANSKIKEQNQAFYVSIYLVFVSLLSLGCFQYSFESIFL